MTSEYNFNSFGERFKRLLCRLFGHDWCVVHVGEPVMAAHDVCRRCGKFERTYWGKA